MKARLSWLLDFDLTLPKVAVTIIIFRLIVYSLTFDKY